MRAATEKQRNDHKNFAVSIHAAREGGDDGALYCGTAIEISIHAAREGGDLAAFRLDLAVHISIHAACEGGDLGTVLVSPAVPYFNPRRL